AVTGGWDDTVRVWDLASGRQVGAPLTGHTGTVSAVACTVLDGTPVAVICSNDGTVRVWDLRSGKLVQSLIAPSCRVAAFTGDGGLVLTLGSDVAVLRRTQGRTVSR
ncbi:hypothetical protein ABZ455_41045, partial [Streptomyces avermitilis]